MRAIWMWTDEYEYGIEPYNPETHAMHASKFLYWNDFKGEPLLLVGDVEYHKEVFDGVNSNSEFADLTTETLVGAGDINFSVISKWSSYGYEVWTPEELKEEIAEALQMRYDPLA